MALEQSIDRMLDYAVPARLVPSLKVGQRVRVPLGKRNRPTPGYVISIQPTTDYPKTKQIKSLIGIEDERVLVPPRLMELARWMSRYYVTPLGAVLDAVIPSAVKKRVGVGYAQMVRLLPRPRAGAGDLREDPRPQAPRDPGPPAATGAGRVDRAGPAGRRGGRDAADGPQAGAAWG